MRNAIITLLMILLALANLPLNAAKLTLTPPKKTLPRAQVAVPVKKDKKSLKSFCGYMFGESVDSLQFKKSSFVKIDSKGNEKGMLSYQNLPRPFRSFTQASVYYSRETHSLYRVTIFARRLPKGVDWGEEFQNVKGLLSGHYRVKFEDIKNPEYKGGCQCFIGNVKFEIGYVHGAMIMIDVRDLYYEDQARRESADVRKKEAVGGTDVL